jgi:gamma-glutamyltranspeptidase/glutathione hydrolase
MEHNSPEYIHCIVEILKNVFADREYHFGDPLFTKTPLEELLSREHARLRLSQIDQSRARLNMPPPVLSGAWIGDAADAPNALRPSLDTSYVAVIDKHGNAFSATPSDASWDVPVVPGTGLVPSSRGSQSRPDPAHPSGARAGKRPRLTPNPAMIVSDGNIMPFGTPGGDVQIQAMLQLLLNRYEFGMSLQAAVEAPRFATFHFPGSFAPFDFHSGLLKLESRVEISTMELLKDLGHRVETWEAYDWRAGGLCAVESDLFEQLIFAGADPRRESYAIGS